MEDDKSVYYETLTLIQQT